MVRLLEEEPEKAAKLGLIVPFAASVFRYADSWREYREKHGDGDPGMGRHRQDDPATIEEMKKGHSA